MSKPISLNCFHTLTPSPIENHPCSKCMEAALKLFALGSLAFAKTTSLDEGITTPLTERTQPPYTFSFMKSSDASSLNTACSKRERLEIPQICLTREEFDKQRTPKTSCRFTDYYPNPSTKRGETFQSTPSSFIKFLCEQDPAVTLRLDAQPSINETIPDYLTRVFQTYTSQPGLPRGFVFAGMDFFWHRETLHGEHPALFFLGKYMPLLKILGIKKIFVEHLIGFNARSDTAYKTHQYFYEDLDDSELPKMDPTLKAICKLSKAYGLEVIGGELFTKYSATTATNKEQRHENFNLMTAAFIHQINEPFVVFVGAAHGKLRTKLVPGLSDCLDCPCIGLSTTQLNDYVRPGTHRFTSIEVSVDAVFDDPTLELD